MLFLFSFQFYSFMVIRPAILVQCYRFRVTRRPFVVRTSYQLVTSSYLKVKINYQVNCLVLLSNWYWLVTLASPIWQLSDWVIWEYPTDSVDLVPAMRYGESVNDKCFRWYSHCQSASRFSHRNGSPVWQAGCLKQQPVVIGTQFIWPPPRLALYSRGVQHNAAVHYLRSLF